jgi:hypothetical protein
LARRGGAVDIGTTLTGAWLSSATSSESPLDWRGEEENNMSAKRALFRPRLGLTPLFHFFLLFEAQSSKFTTSRNLGASQGKFAFLFFFDVFVLRGGNP